MVQGRTIEMASMFNDSGITPQPSYSDLESGTPPKKSMGIAVASVTDSEKPSQRPMLGRRKTTSENVLQNSGKTEKQGGYDGEEDLLTKIGNVLFKVHSASILTRYSLYILPVAALLAIPLVSRPD